MHAVRMTIVSDNYLGLPGLQPLWGFAAVLRLPGLVVLFDTGSNGRVLLRNMAALGVEPADIHLLFLSHPHWDHIGGLDSILEANPNLEVVLHEGFSKHLIADLRGQCAQVIVVGKEPLCLVPGIYSTGMLDSDPPEHALVIDVEGVTAAISGCAHPGMERVVERANQLLAGARPDRHVHWAIGGFHLMYTDGNGIKRVIASLQGLGVQGVIATHCTGDEAKAAFARAYGANCLDGGVGRELLLGAAADRNTAMPG